MFQSENIVEGACSIRPHLPELLGPEAQKVDQEIAQLIAQSKLDQPVHQQLLELLKSYPSTRDWMAEFLSLKQTTRGFEPLPGRSQPTSAQKYVCPQGDYIWYRRSVGTAIPTCPTHGTLISCK